MNPVEAKREKGASPIGRLAVPSIALVLVVSIAWLLFGRGEKPLVFKTWKLETNETGRVVAFFTSTNTQSRGLAVWGGVRMKDSFGQEMMSSFEGPAVVEANGSFFMRAYVPTNDCIWQFYVGHEPKGMLRSELLERASNELNVRGWRRLSGILNPRKLVLAETPVLTNWNGRVFIRQDEKWK